MKSTRTKIAALLLVAVMGITVGGCSKGDSSSNSTGNSASANADANGSASDNSGDSSQEVETIDASDASLKQNMIFLAEDATPGGNAATNSNSTKTEVGGNSDDEYVVVTDLQRGDTRHLGLTLKDLVEHALAVACNATQVVKFGVHSVGYDSALLDLVVGRIGVYFAFEPFAHTLQNIDARRQVVHDITIGGFEKCLQRTDRRK